MWSGKGGSPVCMREEEQEGFYMRWLDSLSMALTQFCEYRMHVTLFAALINVFIEHCWAGLCLFLHNKR